ncbi:MAG: hypothetical protein ACRDRJ_38630 [Streptosporangiaceae bacterium]
MAAEDLEGQIETLTFLNNQISGRMDRQSESLDRIDTKAALVIGYAGAAVTFLATRHPQPTLAGLAYVGYGIAAAFGLAALFVRSYRYLDPRALLDEHAGSAMAVALAEVAATSVIMFETNDRQQGRKVRHWKLSVVALLAATALLVSAILLQTDSHDQAHQHSQAMAAALRR